MRLPIVLLLLASVTAAPPALRTMRVDYFHTGNASAETFSLDEVVLEGAWPGPSGRRLDDSNLGKYFFEVVDRKTNQVLYSRGFASIYGEWELTEEAKDMHRTFHESVRFPEPSGPFQLVMKKRDRKHAFREIWSLTLDPAATTVDRTPQRTSGVWPVMQNGDPRDKVDLLLMGDGYTAAEMDKWHKDARRLAETCLRWSRSRPAGATSTFGRWIRPPRSPELLVRRTASGDDRRCEPTTTHSGPNGTCSLSTTSGCGKLPRPRRTNSRRSW